VINVVNVKSEGEKYKCEVCGNEVCVTKVGGGELFCCGKPMVLMTESCSCDSMAPEKEVVSESEVKRPANPAEMNESEKKHTPVIEIGADGVTVKVGEITHPMEEEHYIQFIELHTNEGVIAKKELKPGDKPEAKFDNVPLSTELKARAMCNLHGLWESV